MSDDHGMDTVIVLTNPSTTSNGNPAPSNAVLTACKQGVQEIVTT